MKCREGCEGERKKRPACRKCWRRVPLLLVGGWLLAKRQSKAETLARAERQILDWLAADDKRRAE